MAKAKHIVVINNSEEILELFEAILHGEAGYQVTRGIYKPRMIEWSKEVMPDLVITDLPYGEEHIGWQLVDKMKMDRETTHIPIVVCTATVQDMKDREGMLTVKNIGVVIKPFDADELLMQVEAKLKQAEG